jgi:3',5'-cyclic AMP phosphodiesterase CpdA
LKRRNFIAAIAAGAAASTALPLSGCNTPSKNTNVFHAASDFHADIFIKGLQKKTRILHLTDTHISIYDESEKRYHEYGARMDNAFLDREHYKTGEGVTSIEGFYELMALAKEQQFDLIALTGDIVNNPSKASVKFVKDEVEKTGIPSVYVAGNHDWHYEGMEGSADELRQTWINNGLAPFYGDNNPLFYSKQVNGLNIVCIDNSTYQVNEEQLVFFEEQASLDMPIVLLMHIPLYTPKDGERGGVGTCGDPRWGEAIDNGFEIERRQRWNKEGNLPSTMEFVEIVKNNKKLAAVFVGHKHRARMDSINANAIQYTTGGSYNGRYRIVEFKSLA